jgi:intergrase/recombinase
MHLHKLSMHDNNVPYKLKNFVFIFTKSSCYRLTKKLRIVRCFENTLCTSIEIIMSCKNLPNHKAMEVFLVPSLSWVWVHKVNFTIFIPTMQKLLNFEHFHHYKFNKKLNMKTLKKLAMQSLHLFGKPSVSMDASKQFILLKPWYENYWIIDF